MLRDWLIIISAVVVLFVLWKFMEYVLDLFAYAANRDVTNGGPEDSP